MKISHSKPYISEKEIEALVGCLKSNNIAKGNSVNFFEENLKNYLDVAKVFTFSSGTAALVASLKILGIQPKDEIIIPSYVCTNVLEAIRFCGASPILCDIDTNWVCSVESVQRKITQKTKAIVAVSTFGIECNLKELDNGRIFVIEDSCQSFGGLFGGRKAGTNTGLGVFSFHATKCLTTGEGGAVAISEQLMQRKNLQDFEMSEKIRGLQLISPMSDVQAVLGQTQLEGYDNLLEQRLKISKRYLEGFKLKNSTINMAALSRSMFFRFPLLSDLDFSHVQEQFEKESILVRRGVDSLIHRNFGLDDSLFPNSVRAFNKTVSVPIYPSMSEEEVERVISAVNKIL